MIREIQTGMVSLFRSVRNFFLPKDSINVPHFVTLFEEIRPEIHICVQMRIRSDGALEVAGLDTGKLVEDLQGKSEYEYYILVFAQDKEILKKKLRTEFPEMNSDNDLLNWFQQQYGKNQAFSEIGQLLKKLEIKHDMSFW